MKEGKPTEKYPDVFRILDIAVWELQLFNRRDVLYGYAYFPTKFGFEEFPDAQPHTPLLGYFDDNGYRFLQPVDGAGAGILNCCGGYAFDVYYSPQGYPPLPFLVGAKP